MSDSSRGQENAKAARAVTGGISQLWANLRAAPRRFRESAFRQGFPRSGRSRAEGVFQNLFLHVHSVRIHRWSLKKSFTWGLGVASFWLFVLLTVTGVMLMLFYKPTTAEAYNSIKEITYAVAGGRLLRNLHRWAAHLMIVTVMLHMARVFFTCSYQKPREFNWLVGIGLLGLTFGLGFTGYCLPWDQLAYWAITIGSNIAGSARELTDALNVTRFFDPGTLIRKMLLGSLAIGDDCLLRFYWLHCVLLPIMTVTLIGIHFWRIRKDGGLSRPDDIRPAELEGIPQDDVADQAFQSPAKTYSLMALIPGRTASVDKDFKDTVFSWPHAFRAEMAVVMAVFAIVLAWSILCDAPLKEAANPNVPENPAKAPWYFLGVQELVSYSGFMGGMLIPAIALAALALIPYLDRARAPAGRWPDRPTRRLIGCSCAFALISVVGLLVFQLNVGSLRDWIPGVNQLWVICFNMGSILFLLSAVFSFVVLKQTASTRMGAIAVFCCFLVFYVVLTYFGTVHRGPNWNFYWWPTQWPGH
ncbi:MAG: cytochrome b N-terminal domain-containing protein [Lentisphaerae bacterium]|nr:cytochrome b N-terminal domain-containing protein [Lentisphaerota bacterium]